MQPTTMRELILAQKGVFRTEPLDAETLIAAVKSEMNVDTISGGMKLENVGMMECARKEYVGVMFCTGEFERPDECSMYMVDTEGTIIGKEVVESEREAFLADPNIIWLSDKVAMYADRITNRDARFMITAIKYAPSHLGMDLDAIIFYPSVPTAKLINQRYGVDDMSGTVQTIVFGTDGPFRQNDAASSVPMPALATEDLNRDSRIGSCGRCGGCCPSTGRPW